MSDDPIKVHPVKASGVTFEVFVSEIGEFFSIVGGERINGPDRNSLEDKLKRQAKRDAVGVEVPFTALVRERFRGRAEHVQFKHGVLTGVHEGNGNPLVRWDEDGFKGQLPSWSGAGNDVLRRLTDEEEAELTRIIEKTNRMIDFKNKKIDDVRVDDPRALIEAEIARKTEEQANAQD